MNAEKLFDQASETGEKILVLKASGVCDCFDPGDIFDSEPDPHCLRCYGTGQKRAKILTQKIRIDRYAAGGQKLESIDLDENIVEATTFFFPVLYSFLTSKDLIATIRDDKGKEITSLFQVANITKYTADDFTYFDVSGKRMNYSPLEV